MALTRQCFESLSMTTLFIINSNINPLFPRSEERVVERSNDRVSKLTTIQSSIFKTQTMSTLIKSQTTHPTSETQPAWAILKQSPVRKVPKREVFNMVLISVAKAFADLNTKSLDPKERDYMVNELTDNIIARYPAIRINEIPVAIANGIRGKYGEFYGLSVVAFERFIEQYLLS